MAKTSTQSKKMSEYLRRFNAAADELEPRFKSNWTRTVNAWQNDPAMVKAMRDLASGKISAPSFAVKAGTVMEAMPPSLRSGLNVIQLRGLNLQGEMLGIDKVKIAGEWAERFSAERVSNITNASREAINTFLSGAITDGIPPRELATHIREVLAVDPRFARAALNYRNGISALEVKPGRVASQTTAYVRRAASQRAKTIARTETMSALAYGQMTALSAARSAGLLDDSAKMVWIAAPGCCSKCTSLDGTTTPIGGGWALDGLTVSPPMHPNCRCVIGVE